MAFVDFFRFAMGWWSAPESTEPESIEGLTLRLRCDNTLTMLLPSTASANSITLRLPLFNTIALRLKASN